MFPGDLALKKIAVLSGGEKSRVSLGKILLTPTNLLLLDEPTNHLDSESCDSLIAALDNFPGTVIMITHNELFLHHLANRLIVFKDNTVRVCEGSYQDFLDKGGWGENNEKKTNKTPVSPLPQKTKDESKPRQKKLLREIEVLEKHLQTLEKTQLALSTELTAAISAGTTEKIKDLQIRNHALTQEITAHYAQLDAALQEFA